MRRACVVLSAAALMLAACKPAAPAPADESAAAADAIRAADVAWEKAVSSKDTTAAVAAMEPTGSVLGANAPISTGPEAVRAMFVTLFAMPAISVHWTVSKTEAARSGELGYSMGTYQLSYTDPKGKPVSDHGKYATIWRKQADGSWKVVADIFNSDLPVPGM